MSRIDLSPDAARAALASLARDGDDDAVVMERHARAVWSCLVEPGDGAAGRIVAAEGAVGALRHVCARADAARSDADIGRWVPRLVQRPITDALRNAAAAGVRLIVPSDAEWPAALADLGEHAPLALWVRGDPRLLASGAPSVAIVGARAASSYGDHVATELAAELAGQGVTIVSGAAYGIDGSAHRAALRAGGTTIASLAGGVDQAYPRGHSGLIDAIAGSGALLSEVPCGAAPTKWRFLQRNRIIAALADATVVVEAGARSGSLNTAGHAAAMGRPLGAVPGAVTSASSVGCHRLLREFDAECITSSADVLEMLGYRAMLPDVPPDDRPPTDDTSRVRDALSTRSWRDAADVARRTGMSGGEVESVLGLLQLTGEVERDARGWRMVSGSRR